MAAHAAKKTKGISGFGLGLFGSGLSVIGALAMGGASLHFNPHWSWSNYRNYRDPAVLIDVRRPDVHFEKKSMVLPHVSVHMERTRVPWPVFDSARSDRPRDPGRTDRYDDYDDHDGRTG